MPTDAQLVGFARQHQSRLLALRDRTADQLVDSYTAVATSRSPIATVLDANDLRQMVTPRGRPTDEVLTRPFVTMRTALAGGAPYQQAADLGRNRAAMIGRTDPMLAARAGSSHAMILTPGIVGYRRVPDGGACSFCLLAATQRYRDSDLMPLHPGCGCGIAPIIGTQDPGQVIDRDALARLKAEGVVDEISLRRRISSADRVVDSYEDKARYWRERARDTADQAAETRYAKRADDWAAKAKDRKARIDGDREQLRGLQRGRREQVAVVEHGELGPVLGPANRPPDPVSGDRARIVRTTSEAPTPGSSTIPTTQAARTPNAPAGTGTAPVSVPARYSPDSLEVRRAAARRNVTPEQAAADLNERAARRAAEQAQTRAEARALTVDHPDVVRVAERNGVTPDEVMVARARVRDVRRVISEEAARVQSEAFATLDHWEARTLRRPPRVGDAARRGEYDWLEQVDDREKARLSRQFYSDQVSAAPDQITARISERLGRDVTTDEAMEMWLEQTRIMEAAGAIRRGRLPSDRAYSGQIDPDTLLAGVAGDGYQITRIVGVDDLDAAGHIAGIDRVAMIDDAEQYLGAAISPQHGPAPFRMSFQSWEEELRDLEFTLANGGSAIDRARYAELVPEFLDEPGTGYEELYTRIVTTARRAEQEVPDYARIPW